MIEKHAIPPLTGLRGIAALWVFAFHACHLVRENSAYAVMQVVGGAGYLGVDVFFVLSGFVLALNYGADRLHQSPAGWGRFLWKRLARIYPVHLATLALVPVAVLALVAMDIPFHRMDIFTADGLVGSLLLTHAWIEPVPRTWNLVSWSISSEWAAYLSFPLIAVAVSRLRSPAAIVLAIGALMAALGWAIRFETFGAAVTTDMLRIAAEFSSGVLLHRLWEMRARPRTGAWDLAACATIAILVLGSNAAALRWGTNAPLPFAPALACLLVYSLACSSGPVARLLSTPGWQYAGAVSYAFYMVHGTILLCARSVLLEWGLTSDRILSVTAIVTALAVTALLAHWIYRSIEQPARARMLAWTAAHRAAGRSIA